MDLTWAQSDIAVPTQQGPRNGSWEMVGIHQMHFASPQDLHRSSGALQEGVCWPNHSPTDQGRVLWLFGISGDKASEKAQYYDTKHFFSSEC